MEEELPARFAILHAWCVQGRVRPVRCVRGGTIWWELLALLAPPIVWSVQLRLACSVLKVSSSQELHACNAMPHVQLAQPTPQTASPAL